MTIATPAPRRLAPTTSHWLEGTPAGRDLTRPELRELAERIAREAGTWEPLVRHDPGERHYAQLHRDPHLDVWLICWSNQQETGLHDHDISSGAVHVCRGDLVEDQLHGTGRNLERIQLRRLEGETFDFDASHVHCIRHPEGLPPAVSIHAYSPALWRMGYYEVGVDGLFRRLSVSYGDEYTAA